MITMDNGIELASKCPPNSLLILKPNSPYRTCVSHKLSSPPPFPPSFFVSSSPSIQFQSYVRSQRSQQPSSRKDKRKVKDRARVYVM